MESLILGQEIDDVARFDFVQSISQAADEHGCWMQNCSDLAYVDDFLFFFIEAA